MYAAHALTAQAQYANSTEISCRDHPPEVKIMQYFPSGFVRRHIVSLFVRVLCQYH